MAVVIVAARSYELGFLTHVLGSISLMETLACPGTFFIPDPEPHHHARRGIHVCVSVLYAVPPKAGSLFPKRVPAGHHRPLSLTPGTASNV